MADQIRNTWHALAMSAAFCVAAGAQGPGGGGMPPAQVQVASVRMEQLAPTISLPGTVISRDESRVATTVPGTVLEVVDVGQRVKKGDPLARLDTFALDSEKVQRENEIAREDSRIRFLEAELERLERLGRDNNAARSQIERTASDLEVARRDQRIAESRLDFVMKSIARSRVAAPFDGLVTERLVQPGERAEVGTPIARVIGQSRIEVRTLAPIRSVRFLDEGTPLRVRGTFNEIDATVRTKVPASGRGAHMFEVRVPVPVGVFAVNEDVRVEVPTAEAEVSLIVPRDALVLRREGTIVYRIGDDDTAQPVSVTPGPGRGSSITVTGDLSAGDRVVTRGAERLQPGQPVQTIQVARREIGGGGPEESR